MDRWFWTAFVANAHQGRFSFLLTLLTFVGNVTPGRSGRQQDRGLVFRAL